MIENSMADFDRPSESSATSYPEQIAQYFEKKYSKVRKPTKDYFSKFRAQIPADLQKKSEMIATLFAQGCNFAHVLYVPLPSQRLNRDFDFSKYDCLW